MIRRWVRAACISAVIVALALFAGVLATALRGDDADLSYRRADYDVTIAANGDMRVVQHLDIRLKDRDNDRPWRQLFQQYRIDPSNLTDIKDVSVTNATTGERYARIAPRSPSSVPSSQWDGEFARHWYIADVTDGVDDPPEYVSPASPHDDVPSKRVEIGWNIPATTKADHLRFDIAMTFVGTATAYDDVAALQWEPIGEDNQIPVGEFSATVRFPQGVTRSNSWAWLHYTGRSTTSRSANGDLHFTASDIRNGQYLNLVTIFDVTHASGVVRHGEGGAKDRIMRQEAQQEQAWRERQQRRARVLLISAVVVAGIGLLLIALGVAASVRSNREVRYHGDIEYWRDPPAMSPASAAALLAVMEPVGSSKLTSRQMAATVLSLASKRAIAIYPGSSARYRGFDAAPYDPSVVANALRADPSDRREATNTIVLLPAIREHRADLRLSASEDAALRLLEKAGERSGSTVFDLNEMREAFKGWSGGYQVQERYQTAVGTEFARLGATSSTGVWARVCGFIALTGALVMGLAYIGLGELALACLVAGPVLFGSCLVIFSARSTGLSATGQELAGQVLGLRRYLQHFSDFKDRGAEDLVLWDRYLVYAAAFGISETAMRQLAKVYPQLTDPQWLDAHAGGAMLYPLYRPYLPAMYGGVVGSQGLDAMQAAPGTLSAGFGDIGAQLSSSFADLSNTIQSAAPSTSSGSSGGSFSGGGFGGMSGGSGGGSFGGR